VSDARLVHIEGLTNLRRLQLGDTAVSDSGKERLRKSLPHVDIDDP
jgi:hypothetical protein